ncbi:MULTISPECIES: efflux RND transporter periplasmic adaptor subunit [unclassified Photobacterium]|uniref:efflux RND transporter periplasmic adaptor subunit n=1 Tax=unclassified Photobacterium TaxID=2628852 RepID=UPI000D166E5B|nr:MULTISPECIES: efflux RND transporter periplasmic adaptor subunit [unclassified Photobacterium]PSV24125.1 efflux transporter periplasmic adaptor subunit [Photobacterium sp. GB-56]PSV32372.1 efflux transporter periplasmic adaptor subunit [Photobacterium sp. GB-72]PSV39893.1 efflux transporter periplasmic adaptor subunit [Photobacterium sp. GB-210]PSV47031.1 efflux transporter periplasmic adaptor subunit [Photobacterium sp. GB-36]PSV54731.1 efflux transporter periplasmic adaptor subunit [Photo
MHYKKLSPLLFTLMALTISNFAHAKDDEKQQAVPVTVEPISTKEFVATLNEVGKINAIDFAELTFSTPGKLVAINFKDGDVVKKGQLIAKLDSSKAKADLDKAASSLTTARNKVKRVAELNRKQPGALSKQDFEELQDAANLAAADYRQQQAILKDYAITAPFDGELTNFTKSAGSMIDATTPLVSIYNLNPVEVSYTISQNDLGKAVKGQPITVTVEAYKDMIFNGIVDYVAPAVNKNTGRVAIHARIENPDHILAPGMFAQVSQMVNGRTNRIVAPQNAILAHNEDRYVWVVDKNNVATKRYLTLGNNLNNGYVIVEKGLKVDDIVVVTGHQKIDDETLVNIIKTQASTADAPAQEQKKKTTDPAKAGQEKTKSVKEQSNETT